MSERGFAIASRVTSGFALGSGLRSFVILRVSHVETREQFDLLENHGCEEAQGSYFSAAVNSESFLQTRLRGAKRLVELIGIEATTY